MRRWMIVLRVAALAVAVLALPGGAKEKSLPDKVVFTEGEFSMGAVEARTGEPAGYMGDGYSIGDVAGWDSFMDPDFNYCESSGTLTWTGKNTARLETKEDCWPRGSEGPVTPGSKHIKIVHINDKSGALKMESEPDNVFWKKVPFLTGCDMNGTFPVYHGHFDGETLRATSHLHSFCDGGFKWGDFGIGAEDGPIHVTYEFELRVTPSS